MKTLIKNGTLAVLTDKAAFFIADGCTIEKQVPLSNYKFEGWEDGADFDALQFEAAHIDFIEKNNVRKAEKESEKAVRLARSFEEAKARRELLTAQDMEAEVTVYYADAYYFTGGGSDSECYFNADFELLKEWADGFCSRCPQGQSASVAVFKITCRPSELSDFNEEYGFDREEELYPEFLIRVFSEKIPLDAEFDDYFTLAELDTIVNTPESIEGRLIISYEHQTYMNYSHRLTGMRIGERGETTADLSNNPDQAFKRWDMLTDITLEKLAPDEAEELIREEIKNLKYDGPGKPSLRSFIESSSIYHIIAPNKDDEY